MITSRHPQKFYHYIAAGRQRSTLLSRRATKEEREKLLRRTYELVTNCTDIDPHTLNIKDGLFQEHR
jgi:hypothetical protein